MEISEILSEFIEIGEGLVKGKVKNVALGSRRSLILGDGREKHDISEWEPGDPFNSIDWALTLIHWPEKIFKVNRLETKVLPLVVAVDATPSMLVRFIGEENKFKLMLQLMATLCFSSIHERDPICITSFGNPSAFFLPPRYGRSNLFLAAEILLEDAELFYKEMGNSGTPSRKYLSAIDLNECLADILGRIKTQSTVVVISDFYDVVCGRSFLNEDLLSALVARHKENVIFLLLDDANELAWTGGVGTVMTRNIETGQFREMKSSRAKPIRDEYLQRQNVFRAYLENQGVDSLALSSRDWPDRLLEFAISRTDS